MATVAQDELTDEEQQQLLAQQQAAADAGSAPSAVPGTDVGASGAGGNKSAAGPTSGQSPQSSGLSGFTAVSDYLNANAPQAQDLASKVAGGLTDEANDISGSINAADSAFKSSVDQGSARPDETLVNEAAANPVDFSNDPNKVAAFQKAKNASYTGPNKIDDTQDFGPLQGKVQAGNTDAGLVDSEGGRSTLIQRLPGTHTAGMNTLDQMLLEQGPGTQSTLKAAAEPFKGLQSYLDQVRGGSADYASKAKADTEAAGKLVADKFTNPGGVIPGFQNDLTGRLTAAEKEREGFNSNFDDIIAKLQGTAPAGFDQGIKPLTTDEANALGVPQSAIDRYALADQILGSYGETPAPIANLLTGGRTASNIPSLSSVANPEDYAKAAALEKMMGGPLSFISQDTAPQAGSYAMNGTMPSLDQKGAQALIDSVNTHDKNAADAFITNNYGYLNNQPDKYAKMLQLVLTDPSLKQGGILGGAQLLGALNRLVNGFGAPDLAFTPVQSEPPYLQPPSSPPSSGGGFHTF